MIALRRPAVLLPLLLGIALLPVALAAQDARQPIPGTSLDEERAALLRARAQAEEARKRSEALEASARKAANAADRTRDQIAALAARIQQSEADLRAGEARVGIIARLQRAQAKRLAERQTPIVRLTAALQQIARRSPVLTLVEPGTVGDAVHRRIVLAQVMPVVMARTRDLRAEIARSADLRESAEAAAGALARTRDGLAAQQQTLASLEQRQRVASRQLRDSASLEIERSLAMAEEARDIGELMQTIEEAGVIRDALLALPGPVPRPDTPDDAPLPRDSGEPAGASLSGDAARAPIYRLPVVGDVVTGFGEVSESGLRARGLTILTAPGATVVAPAAGRIAFAGPFRGYGQIVIMEHGGGWTSLVARMDRVSAQVGDIVRQGDPLGATGPGKPRLLVELRRQDRPIDIGALLR
ncbi:peptidase M23B family protein [Sphingobium sp. SYK-6]|uniref:murein hydrolase activator EnvC family protein n=1 Tax=Sphingobium sp. (strain NBRC 103272 / SYK-6) TaxID=627192 RepID=UPI0002277627|nr:peptidoglycan DD-metalloendopeptidase family protein [Sphingobium sp. SYK-6]BAK67839.1 peptidase M23B family protein [Sphingobium sp. SYK-6]